MSQVEETEVREGSFANMIEVSKELQIVADGPLSQMFAASLNKLYAKEVDEETGIAIESQALDAQNSQGLWMANKIAGNSEDVGMLYGVLQHEASLQDVIRVADALTEMTDQEKAKSAVVIVTNERDAATGKTFQNFHYGDPMAKATSPLYAHEHDWATRVYRANNTFARSLKEVAEAHGVKVCPSLEAYLEHVKTQG